MTIYDLKPAFQNLLRPICHRLAARGITPNQVTLAALGLSLIVGGLLFLSGSSPGALLLVPLTLFVRMALNAIDGMLAREHDMQSNLGAVLNEMGDVVSDTALYLPFALIGGVSAALVVCVVLLAVLSEMMGVVAVQVGSERRYEGPMGKSDRAFGFGLLALLLGLGVPAGWWVNVFLAGAAVLSARTILNRARGALAEANQ